MQLHRFGGNYAAPSLCDYEIPGGHGDFRFFAEAVFVWTNPDDGVVGTLLQPNTK